MKKIIILFITLLLCTGCYDYKEINDLAIISAIGINFNDDNYEITLEILNDQIDKDSSKITSYIKTGTGKNLTSAIENAADKLSKKPTFNHVKLMLIGDNVTKEKFSNIIDLFLRNTYFRENFYVISTINDSPEKVLSNITNEKPVASQAITNLLESVSYSSNTNILKKYDEIVEEVITYGVDTCFSNITLQDEEFIINGMSIFHNYDFKGLLDNEDVKTYNLLTNNFDRPTYTKNYEDKSFTVAINDGKIEASINEGTIEIKGNLMGRILDNDPKINIRNINNLTKLDNDFTNILNEKIKSFLKTIQEKDSDLLGLTRGYYQKTRTQDKNYWKKLDINANIDFYINKKGLIYEVEKES